MSSLTSQFGDALAAPRQHRDYERAIPECAGAARYRRHYAVLGESTACNWPSSPGTQAPVSTSIAKNSVKHRPYWE